MKNIILQNDLFKKNISIVPIINIKHKYKDKDKDKDKDKESVEKIFESSLYLSGFETTRKISKGICIHITNESVNH